MKKLMKSSQIPRFKTSNRIVYGYYPIDDNRAVVVPFEPKTDGIEEISKRRKEAKNGHFQINVFGNVICFRLPDKGDFPVASFNKSDQESVLKSIHFYLLDFFGDSVDYQWHTTYDKQHFIPQLPNLSVCLTINPFVVADMKRFEDFLSSTPVLKHVQMLAWTTGQLSPESKFYQAESIRTSQTSPTFPAVLRYFQGKQAFLSIRKWEDLDFIEFVKRWKSGEAFRKLEDMTIRITDSFKAPQDGILNAIGVKYIDATRQPPTHTLPKV
ncbi:unnamed protein product [Caenorhabditis nigoni]